MPSYVMLFHFTHEGIEHVKQSPRPGENQSGRNSIDHDRREGEGLLPHDGRI